MLKEHAPNGCHLQPGRLKQHDMRAAGFDHPSLPYLLGRARRSATGSRLRGVTIVVHAAALEAGSQLSTIIGGHSDQHHGRP